MCEYPLSFSLSCVFLSLPSHSLFFCPLFIYNRTWQGIISCIMNSDTPVIYTVTVYYNLLSLKTLNVNYVLLKSCGGRKVVQKHRQSLLLPSRHVMLSSLIQAATVKCNKSNYCRFCMLMNWAVIDLDCTNILDLIDWDCTAWCF